MGSIFGAALIGVLFAIGAAMAQSPCRVQHPLQPPRTEWAGRCPNCGMVRALWARTWIIYHDGNGDQQACSMHCLADRAAKSGQRPDNVRVALYLEPESMAPAAAAHFVVGSSAPGTMSQRSTAAFAARHGAQAFARTCGGQVMRFAAAFAEAAAALPVENPQITLRRLANGKIIEPVDGRDRCAVCEMFPARYPRHRAQIRTGAAAPVHFCSTQCLFGYLSRMPSETRRAAMVWVSDTVSGEWTSGLAAFYVVGSGKFGPMGHEAFAFSERAAADAFIRAAGKGRRLAFDAVTPKLIVGNAAAASGRFIPPIESSPLRPPP